MTWPAHIERLKPLVYDVCKDIPADLILAVIRRESNGVIGRVANSRTKLCRQLPTRQNTKKRVCHAMGLMQCVPVVVDDWNKSHAQKVTVDDMTGKSSADGRIQIKIGCELFRTYLKNLNHYDSRQFPARSPANADSNQLQMSLFAYRMGYGALQKKLDILKREGKPLTYESMLRRFPRWGYDADNDRWVNRPVKYVTAIWTAYRNRSDSDNAPVQTVVAANRSVLAGFDAMPIVLIGAAIVASYALKKFPLLRGAA